MEKASKNPPFAEILAAWPEERVHQAIAKVGPEDVTRALSRELLHSEDLAALLSPQAASRLEERRYRGRTM